MYANNYITAQFKKIKIVFGTVSLFKLTLLYVQREIYRLPIIFLQIILKGKKS